MKNKAKVKLSYSPNEELRGKKSPGVLEGLKVALYKKGEQEQLCEGYLRYRLYC